MDRPKIIVVDDDLDFRAALQSTLEHPGFQVVAAANGMDRLELTRRIRASARPVPVILITGFSEFFGALMRLFESAPGLYLALRPDLTIAAVSGAYLRATMTVRDRIVGKGLFEVFPDNPDDAGATGTGNLRASLDRVLRRRIVDAMPLQKYDIRRPEAEGGGFEVRWWNPVNSPVLNERGEVAFIIHRVEDVTRLVLQEGERKVIEQERDLFFTCSLDMLGIAGTDGYFKQINPAFTRVLGYTEEEFCAKPYVEFVHPEDAGRTTQEADSITAGQSAVAFVNRYRCKDGTYKWLSWSSTSVGPVHYAAARDITEQVNAERKIRELNQELARRNEDLERRIEARLQELQDRESQIQHLQKMDAIGRLAGGVAHDFNNMLGAIQMYGDLLADEADDPAAVRSRVGKIRGVTERAAALTRQLLMFSRKRIIQPRLLDLNPLLDELHKLLERLLGENIEVVTRFSSDLAPVRADPGQLEQVFMNLVLNARDAMPSGGRITLETSNVYLDEAFTSTHLSVDRGHYVLITVADEGMGMDTATLTRIFEPFFTTKPVGQGTGLGLSIAYGIIEQCGGTIRVYSEPGRGTVFKIYLPVVQGSLEEPRPAPPSRSVAPAPGQTLLVVEDDPTLREGFALRLKKLGYQVLLAEDAGGALALCRTHPGTIDLMLTDVVMPGTNGFTLAREAEQIRPEMRVLYMSGYPSEALEASGVGQMEDLAFIQKPFDTAQLAEKIREVLQTPDRSPSARAGA